jgi:hypothetical protein
MEEYVNYIKIMLFYLVSPSFSPIKFAFSEYRT